MRLRLLVLLSRVEVSCLWRLEGIRPLAACHTLPQHTHTHTHKQIHLFRVSDPNEALRPRPSRQSSLAFSTYLSLSFSLSLSLFSCWHVSLPALGDFPPPSAFDCLILRLIGPPTHSKREQHRGWPPSPSGAGVFANSNQLNLFSCAFFSGETGRGRGEGAGNLDSPWFSPGHVSSLEGWEEEEGAKTEEEVEVAVFAEQLTEDCNRTNTKRAVGVSFIDHHPMAFSGSLRCSAS
ncbi:hypothetical protein LX36DRAFT_108628 [Colletotrichum falcatum]|nr:hypothetical protein LX36DRAFT_108628 [Colletotrichum falcatum]